MKDLTELELFIVLIDVEFAKQKADFERLRVVQTSIVERFEREIKARPVEKILAAVKQLGEIEPELAGAGEALKAKFLEMASKL